MRSRAWLAPGILAGALLYAGRSLAVSIDDTSDKVSKDLETIADKLGPDAIVDVHRRQRRVAPSRRTGSDPGADQLLGGRIRKSSFRSFGGYAARRSPRERNRSPRERPDEPPHGARPACHAELGRRASHDQRIRRGTAVALQPAQSRRARRGTAAPRSPAPA